CLECFHSQMPTPRCLPNLTRSCSSASLHLVQKPSTTLCSKPSSPASWQKSFIPCSVLWPPSRYFHTARPGLIHSVCSPLGNSFGSGGGQRLWITSLLTSVLRSAPISTTRQGEAIGPVTTAGLDSRSTSSW